MCYIPVITHSFTPNTEMHWSLTELVINYRGGFVRRGLLGELAYPLLLHSYVTLVHFFAGLYLIVTFLLCAGLARLLRGYAAVYPAMAVLIMLSPALLLFAAYSPLAYMRKETLLVLLLVTHGLAARRYNEGRISAVTLERFYWYALLPLLCGCMLIHEMQLFLLPAHMLITRLTLRFHARKDRGLYTVYAVPVLLGMLAVAHTGNAETMRRIVQSVHFFLHIEPEHTDAIWALSWSLRDGLNLSAQVFSDPASLASYAVGWLLAAVLPALLLGNIALRAWGARFSRRELIVAGALAACVPLLLLPFGWDFGRWIHLAAFSVAALFLSLPPPAEKSQTVETLRRWPFWIVSFLYVAGWNLPHCCINSGVLSSGFMAALHNELAILQSLI